MLLGHLFKHLRKKHMKPSVALDEFLEFFQDRNELLLVVVSMADLRIEPFFVDAMICRKPGSCLDLPLLGWDIVVVSVLVDHDYGVGVSGGVVSALLSIRSNYEGEMLKWQKKG